MLLWYYFMYFNAQGKLGASQILPGIPDNLGALWKEKVQPYMIEADLLLALSSPPRPLHPGNSYKNFICT